MRECAERTMPYKIKEHTADLRLMVFGGTLEELFQSAFGGIMESMRGAMPSMNASITRTVSLEAPDATVLLIDFLNDVLTLSHIHKELYSEVVFKKITETALEAELHGAHISEFAEDIKAATYHEADVTKDASGMWRTNLIFDI